MTSPYVKNGEMMGVPMNGMNRYFVGTSAIGSMVGAMHAGSSFMDNAWDDNPNKFQQLGSDSADVVGELSMLGMSFGFLGQHARARNTVEGAYHNGSTYKKLAAGGWEGIGKGAGSTLKDDQMKAFFKDKSAFKVNVRGEMEYAGNGARNAASRLRGTYRPMGWKGNVGMMAGQIAIGIGAKFALGFAGKVLDQAYAENRSFRKPHYDQRFFNTQRQDQSSYQQLGQAMDSYENKMMSVARIYHAR